MSKEKTGLAAALVLHTICCGGLLLVVAGASLGSVIAALAGNGWVQVGGVAVAALGVGWWLARRRQAKECAFDSESTAELRGKVSKRERNNFPGE